MGKIIKTNFSISSVVFGVIIFSLFTGFISDLPAAEKTRVRWIGVDQINKIIEEQKPIIVDLRTPGEFHERGIYRAQLMFRLKFYDLIVPPWIFIRTIRFCYIAAQ